VYTPAKHQLKFIRRVPSVRLAQTALLMKRTNTRKTCVHRLPG
jgi:hypothetical protein